jgi:hypothetical protein
VGVRWFRGLTCDFWAENAKNNYKDKKQKQIPFGDGNKKGKSSDKGQTTAKAKSINTAPSA